MNKKEFIQELKFLLSDFPQNEVEDIIYDYEEHFLVGLDSGKTEEEIATGLGDVRLIARQYRASMKIEKARNEKTVSNIFNAVLATIGLGFFNLVIVLGPFLGVLGTLIGLFAASIGIAVSGFALTIASFGAAHIPFDIPFSIGFPVMLFAGIGLACFGILFFLGNFYISKFFYIFTLKYLRWNIDVIRGSNGGVR